MPLKEVFYFCRAAGTLRYLTIRPRPPLKKPSGFLRRPPTADSYFPTRGLIV